MGALDLSNLQSYTEAEEVTTEAPEIQHVQWAFIVYKTYEGETIMHHDINTPVVADRTPHPDEVHGAAANIQSDIDTMKTAGHTAQATVNGLMQVQAQMAQQQQNAMIQQQLMTQKLKG